MAAIYTQAAAMRSQLLDIKYSQSCSTEHPAYRTQSQVREMLVINSIKLRLFYKPHHVRKFERDGAERFECSSQAIGEIINVRYVSVDIVTYYEIGLLALR